MQAAILAEQPDGAWPAAHHDERPRLLARAVEAAFDQLPDDYREALTLHELCGLSHADIAARMGKSEGAVRNLVYRGISRLARLVDSER